MIVFRLGKHLHDLCRKGKQQKYCKQQNWGKKNRPSLKNKKSGCSWFETSSNNYSLKLQQPGGPEKNEANDFPIFSSFLSPENTHEDHSTCAPLTGSHGMAGSMGVGWNRRRGDGADCGMFKKLRVIQLLCKKWRIKDVVVFFVATFQKNDK